MVAIYEADDILQNVQMVSPSVMVNFMCQLDWVMGVPIYLANIILGMSVRVFLEEINI